jgi:hypothetical protein
MMDRMEEKTRSTRYGSRLPFSIRSVSRIFKKPNLPLIAFLALAHASHALTITTVQKKKLQTHRPAGQSGSRSGSAWTDRDSLDAALIVDAIQHRPWSIDSLTAGALARDHDLGFGHRLREAWINPSGALGFAFKIVYAGSRPISFEAKPVMNYGGLRARYRRVLAPVFKTMGSGPGLRADPFIWNLDSAAAPLPADSLKLAGDSLPAPALRSVLAFYMSPYSGTLYGIRGGEAGQMLENRDHFLELTEILMADKRLARYLLRSINPAFTHPLMAATMRGGRESAEDPRKLVGEYASREVRRDGRGVLRMY